jgi:hypothetical protein
MNWLLLLHGIFLSGGVGWMQDHPMPPPPYTYWRYDINVVDNPYGIVEAGVEYPLGKKLSFVLAGRHISSINAGDYGVNTFEIHLKWRPFGE